MALEQEPFCSNTMFKIEFLTVLKILKEFLTLQEYCTPSLLEMFTFNIKFFLSKLNNEGQDGVGGGGGG
jgi:hypothetical protein